MFELDLFSYSMIIANITLSWKACSGSANFRVAEEVKEPHILCSSQFKCFLVFSSGNQTFPGISLCKSFFSGISWQIKVFPLADQGITLGKSIFPRIS